VTRWGLDVLSVEEPREAELRLEPDTFDVVHCAWLLHRLADPHVDLSEMGCR